MTIRYRVEIDRDHDGAFSDPGGEISERVLELEWRLGMASPYDGMAADSWARISLRNHDGAFSPERHRLESGTRVRIQSVAGGQTRAHFTGYLSHVELEAGAYGTRRAILHLADLQAWLRDSPARLEPQVDVTADAVIGRLLDGATLRRAAIAGYCLIDVPGYSQIDACRVFPARNVARRLERGRTRFAYVGDWWRETTSTLEAIGDVVESKRGRFFIDRAGEPVFLNRHHTLVSRQLRASLDDDMIGMRYQYGERRLNQISLSMRPRAIGQRDTLLWQLRQPLRIDRFSELRLSLRLLDERERPVGLLELDRLEARFRHGRATGEEWRENVSAEAVSLGAASVEARVSNQSREDLYLTALELYGKPLYRGDKLAIRLGDGAGMHVYGLKSLSLELPALSDLATAQAFAAYELARRRHPRGMVEELWLEARDHPQAALGASLFDRVRVSESQTGHGAREYFIVAEAHHVGAGGTRHETRWTLEPADSARFVIVDDSRVDAAAEAIAPY